MNNLIDLFGATYIVLENIAHNRLNNNIEGQAMSAYEAFRSFQSVFILHLINKVMGITNMLCQALQMKSQDIFNAMRFVSTTKTLLERLHENGWDAFIGSVFSLCESHDIDILDMNACYMIDTWCSYQQHDHITYEYFYRVNIFIVVIDFELVELDNRFKEETIEFLTPSSCLNPSNGFKSFNIDDICSLAKKFYPNDFTT